MIIMTNEKKQAFTRRITQANRTQLVVILYEMLLVYLEDANDAYSRDNKQEFVQNLNMVRECIKEMRVSLNFEYDISMNLFALYCFADKEVAADIYGYKTDNLNVVRMIFTKLHDAYQTVSKKDDSAPLMDNIQTVYAGITYGRTDINESFMDNNERRGFFA